MSQFEKIFEFFFKDSNMEFFKDNFIQSLYLSDTNLELLLDN